MIDWSLPVETQLWDGEPPIAWYWKVFPIWWFGNREGIDPTYHPEWSQWRRALIWYTLRNPLFNFFRYVVGLEDRSLIVTGPIPVFTTSWFDANGTGGWKWAILRDGHMAYPFICYSRPAGFTFYLGWLPSGGRFSIRITGNWS